MESTHSLTSDETAAPATATAAVAEKKIVVLRSGDGEEFEVESSGTIRNMINDVLSAVLDLEYMNKNPTSTSTGRTVYLEKMSKELDAQEFTSGTFLVKDMLVEEAGEYIGVMGDFTPEEAAEVRKENAFD